MKNTFLLTLLILVLAHLSACNRPPADVEIDGNRARVFTIIEVVPTGDGVRFQPTPARLEVRKWLYENNFEYSHHALINPNDPEARYYPEPEYPLASRYGYLIYYR